MLKSAPFRSLLFEHRYVDSFPAKRGDRKVGIFQLLKHQPTLSVDETTLMKKADCLCSLNAGRMVTECRVKGKRNSLFTVDIGSGKREKEIVHSKGVEVGDQARLPSPIWRS